MHTSQLVFEVLVEQAIHFLNLQFQIPHPTPGQILDSSGMSNGQVSVVSRADVDVLNWLAHYRGQQI